MPYNNLKKNDPLIYQAMRGELKRQQSVLEMIASENIVSPAVIEAMGTVMTNKYSEGYPDHRYYGGNQFIDISEKLAIERAKKLFNAEHVNVQPHAGSQANMEAYFAVLELGDKILAMNLAHGGHLTHGHPVNFSGKFYKVTHYGVDKKTEQIDMDEVRRLAKRDKPKLILAGASAYPRKIDFKAFRQIADEVGAYFMADIAHIAGLVAARLHPDPIPYCDIVTTTTHKTLRGPRGAMIMCKTRDRLRPQDKKNLAQKIDSAVFPGMQGGPLDHIIAAKAVAFGEALKPAFKKYQAQIISNAATLAETLTAEGLRLISGGTDNHLMLVDVTPLGVNGKQAEMALDEVGICCNKNMIPYDTRSPFDPSGIRLGTPALTTRGMKTREMKIIGGLIGKLLKNISSQKIKREIKAAVKMLTDQFPIYAGLEQAVPYRVFKQNELKQFLKDDQISPVLKKQIKTK
ncbi:MAG TPA: serine hydroxymethyltransferase [Candidatus Jacksonbacteria bacterium]|nr:MAG: serine hydroxymethyltransferase [Parcubacteria group bacterium GW2011_GWC2_44_22]HBH46332.1 serine hydroxymethyltransferase [Candidatus Jacksonbacteria bacterium]HCC50195.1 serine hydroxymethyltransferase [Candidatus Jacksonbacteria bacterium]HCE49777.1 serine hydroxymethyltransferase [Candidatus Jacksonbacteria bacterium]HCR15480.1 serine hydroxymethyltransferase [Candidatus Jacksonbacteria bacterium]